MKTLRTLLIISCFLLPLSAQSNGLSDSTTTNQTVIAEGKGLSSGGSGTRRILKDVNLRSTWEGGKTNKVNTPPWNGRSWQQNDYTYFEVRWPNIYKCAYAAGNGTSCSVLRYSSHVNSIVDLRTSRAMDYVDGVTFTYSCYMSGFTSNCSTATARWIQ